MSTSCGRRMARMTLGAALAAVPILTGQASAEDMFPEVLPHECTADNVAGIFGFNEDTASSPGIREPRAFVGIIDLQPGGTAMLQKRGFRERGGDVRQGQLLEGTWTIDANCFGFVDFPEQASPGGNAVEFDMLFVAVENATELLLITNNPLEEMDAKLLFRR